MKRLVLIALPLALAACAPTHQSPSAQAPAYLHVGQTWTVNAVTVDGKHVSYTSVLEAPEVKPNSVEYRIQNTPVGTTMHTTTLAYFASITDGTPALMAAEIQTTIDAEKRQTTGLCAMPNPKPADAATGFTGAFSTQAPNDALMRYLKTGDMTGLGTCTLTLSDK